MASEKEGITTRDGFPPNENTQNYTLRKRTRTRQTERERITESAERHCSCYWEFMLRKNLLPAKLCFNSPLAMKWSLYIAHQSTAKWRRTEKKRRRRNRNSPQLQASERASGGSKREEDAAGLRSSHPTTLALLGFFVFVTNLSSNLPNHQQLKANLSPNFL